MVSPKEAQIPPLAAARALSARALSAYLCMHFVILESPTADNDPPSGSISWHHIVLAQSLQNIYQSPYYTKTTRFLLLE